MHVARMRLKNVGPYKGDHVLALEAKPYAINATYVDDPTRSNAAGKSFLAALIRHALYGEHNRRTEDGWITDGETVAENELTLSDGARIMRSRHRGKSTRIYFWKPDAPVDKPATQGEAERMIAEYIGLSRPDFDATCYFEQKAMARMILATPEERMRIVSAWLELAPLVRAEEVARRRLSAAMDAAQRIGRTVDSLIDERARLLGLGNEDKRGAGARLMIVQRKEERARVQVDVTEKRTARQTADQALVTMQQRMALFADAARHAEVLATGKRVKDDLERVPPVDVATRDALTQRVTQVEVEYAQHHAKVTSLRVVAQGRFDGKCPVASIECPARDTINGMRKTTQVELDAAIVNLDKVEARRVELRSEIRTASNAINARTELEAQRARLLGEEKALRPAAQAVAKLSREELERALQSARARQAEAEALHMEAVSRLNALDVTIKRLDEIEAELATYADSSVATNNALELHRVTMGIFGRNGVQRIVAEEALGDIEAGANDELSTAGIDLRVAVRWSREGDGLADACDACGAAFPASKKIRTCTRCGADRGPKLVNKLEIEPSRRSGGNDDLGGIYFQLSASRWLRTMRGCMWETAIIDEPTSALDRSAQRAVGRHIVSTLAATGFAQSFLIAHHPGILDMLPGRIEVTSDGVHATVKVTA
jgi:DNA repair exonuclease SbcCD ATPase subunit